MAGPRFSDSFLAELKSRIRVSDVVGRKVKLRKQGKEWAGLSPFTAEKTPSFFVNDQKQFYKCFSSGQFGDVITFVMETERLSFNEAVEKLAEEAGMALPTETPAEREQRSQRAIQLELLEKATVWFEERLQSKEGQAAREYLERRGLSADAQARHRIGYAPDGWRSLIDHFAAQGGDPKQLIDVGLAVQPESGRDPYDRFRNRVIFPIADTTGKVVAFGGRALEKDAKPKYLNSPETDLFHKGQQLYRYKAAREALGASDGRGLIVCEGYMDAIALAEAGLGAAVAPLGTALTEDQLNLLWRVGPEPVLCFDGDAAGQRAAFAAIDRALPFLEPEKTLYFCLLPDGLDPDDLIRTQGADVMAQTLGNSRPFVDLLWSRELNREPIETPERRAAFESRLFQSIDQIKHEGVRRAYQTELRQRLRDYFFQKGRRGAGEPRKRAEPQVKRTAPPIRGVSTLIRIIESPRLLEYGYESLLSAEFDNPDTAALRDVILDVFETRGELDREHLTRHLEQSGHNRLFDLLRQHPAHTPVNPDTVEGQERLRSLEQYASVKRLPEDLRRLRDEAANNPVDQASVRARASLRAEIRVLGADSDDVDMSSRDVRSLREAIRYAELSEKRKSDARPRVKSDG